MQKQPTPHFWMAPAGALRRYSSFMGVAKQNSDARRCIPPAPPMRKMSLFCIPWPGNSRTAQMLCLKWHTRTTMGDVD
jgi:hypothetical protein